MKIDESSGLVDSQLETALAWGIGWAGLLAVGVAVLLVLYGRLLRALRTRHPGEYEALGRPTLLMGSPRRSLALQRFLYVGSRAAGIDPAVARLCVLIGVLTPLFVVALAGALLWGVADALSF